VAGAAPVDGTLPVTRVFRSAGSAGPVGAKRSVAGDDLARPADLTRQRAGTVVDQLALERSEVRGDWRWRTRWEPSGLGPGR
jgi:hypothetical protein